MAIVKDFSTYPKSRKEALALGAKRFFLNKPCPKGHNALREAKKSTCIECIADKNKRLRLSDTEKHNKKAREWAAANRYKVREIEKRYWSKNLEKQREKNSRWQKNNPDYVRNRNSARRKIERTAEGKFTFNDITEILIRQNWHCVYCYAMIDQEYEIDHIRPLSRGGSNWPSNLQATCESCNCSKGNKTHEEFLEYKRKNGVKHVYVY